MYLETKQNPNNYAHSFQGYCTFHSRDTTRPTIWNFHYGWKSYHFKFHEFLGISLFENFKLVCHLYRKLQINTINNKINSLFI